MKKIQGVLENTIVITKSEFITHIYRVDSVLEVEAILEETRKKYWDATHNCYAYIIGENAEIQKCSDDGEPAKTAGAPMIDVLKKQGITNILAIVTRYFGGTLLGAGGLVRAYSHSAKLATEASHIIKMEQCLMCTLECNYNQYGKVSALVAQCGGTVDDSVFGTDVELSFHITQDGFNRLTKELADATCGEVEPVEEFKEYFAVEL
jgi:uncharacterized YigZ family protein